ncbi:MAG: hypothetical protein J7M39_05070 [Anaerolineae bacterium]|nr:hypothetical protein [Anaerolineae bacterium]
MGELKDLVCDNPAGELGGIVLETGRSHNMLYSVSDSQCKSPESYGGKPPRYGEVANGSFTAPCDGLLIVEVTGSSRAADVYGSCAVSGTSNVGWVVPPGSARGGEKIDTHRCVKLLGNERFQFNVQTGRDNGKSKLRMRFYWFYLDTAETYQLQWSKKDLDIRIEPLAVTVDRTGNLVPEFRKSSAGSGLVGRIPIGCGGMTDWFMVWPTDTTQPSTVENGHAKGWTIGPDWFRSPDLNGEKGTCYGNCPE